MNIYQEKRCKLLRSTQKCSTSHTTREVHMRTIMRYCLTSNRKDIIQNTTENKDWQG